MKNITKTMLMLALFAFFATPALANDLCADATPISCGDFISGDTSGDTFDAAPFCGTSNTAAGEWYIFTPTEDASVVVSLCGSSYDTKLTVYTGSCAGLSCVGGNDDFCGLQSQVTFSATAGTEYKILVHGFGSATGSFNLAVSCTPIVGNDACSGAVAISCGETVSGSTTGATFDGAAFCGTSNTAPGVWYTLTSQEAQGIILTTCSPNTNYDTKISVFEGSCGGLVCVDGDDDDFQCPNSGLQSTVVFFNSQANTTYYILVHGFGSATGDFELSAECISAPDNDDPCAAIPLVVDVPTEYTNLFATADDGEVSPGAGTGASTCNSQDGWCSFETDVDNSVWFSFVVPASGAVSVEAPGFDSQLAVWSVTDCSDYSTYSEIGANDDSGEGLSALVELYCLTPGDTFLVQLDGFNGATINNGLITVKDLGGEPLSVDAGGCQTKFVGYEPAEGLNNLAATVTGGTAPYTYLWSGPGIVTDPNIFSVSVDPTETTTYTVTVTDANGCVAEDTVEVNYVDLFCDAKEKKILVCHVPEDNSDNDHEVCISVNAVEAHLAHGDRLGPCENTCLDTNPPPPQCVDVSIAITTDNFGGETSWTLTDENGGIVASGASGTLPNNTTTTVYEDCILPGCYSFNIFDSFGDGICCSFGEGRYVINYDGEVTESPTGGAFGSDESVEFGECTRDESDDTVVVAPGGSISPEVGEVSVLPNPFSSKAVIKYIPAFDGKATIDIYTINGALVSRILDTPANRGEVIHADVNGSLLRTSGIYIYKLQIADKTYSGKLVYMN